MPTYLITQAAAVLDWPAMSVEAALAASVVVLGIVTAHRLKARRDRWRRIVEATQEVQTMLPMVVTGWVAPEDELDHSLGGEWHSRHDRLHQALRHIRSDAALLPRRPRWWPRWSWWPASGPWRRERVQAALAPAMYRVSAADVAYYAHGRVLPLAIGMTIDARELAEAVLGPSGSLDMAVVDDMLEAWGLPDAPGHAAEPTGKQSPSGPAPAGIGERLLEERLAATLVRHAMRDDTEAFAQVLEEEVGPTIADPANESLERLIWGALSFARRAVGDAARAHGVPEEQIIDGQIRYLTDLISGSTEHPGAR